MAVKVACRMVRKASDRGECPCWLLRVESFKHFFPPVYLRVIIFWVK